MQSLRVLAVLAAVAVTRPSLAADGVADEIVVDRIAVGEQIFVPVSSLVRVLNFDPRVAQVEQRPDGLTIVGLEWGTATVRLWTAEGVQVIRVPVTAPAPATTADEERWVGATPAPRGLSVRGAGHVFARSASGAAAPWVGVQDVGMAWAGSERRIEAGAWVEEHRGGFELPHALLELSSEPRGDAPRGKLSLGTTELNWGSLSFQHERIAGAKVEFSVPTPAAARGWGLEAAWGADVHDYPVMGYPMRFATDRTGSRGGLRTFWTPLAGLSTDAAIAVVRDAGQTVAISSLGTTLDKGPVTADAKVVFDGAHLGGVGGFVVAAGNSRVGVRAEGTEPEFSRPNLRGPSPGYSTVSADLGHRFEKGPSLALSSMRSQIGTLYDDGGAILDPRVFAYHLLSAGQELGDHVAVSASASYGVDDAFDTRWDLWEGTLGVGVHDIALLDEVTFGAELTAKDTRSWAEGERGGRYGFDELSLAPAIGAFSWLQARGTLTLRASGEQVEVRPKAVHGDVALTARVPLPQILAVSDFSVGYRSWDFFSTAAGQFFGGRSMYAQLGMGTQPWKGLSVLGNFNAYVSPDTGVPSFTAHVVVQFGASNRQAAGPSTFLPLPRRVRGTVFDDLDGDGLLDDGEPGLAGALIELDPDTTVLSDERGRFGMWVPSRKKPLFRLADSGDDGKVLTTAEVQSADEAPDGRIAFGFTPLPATVFAMAFNDLDGDGIKGTGEPLVGEVPLRFVAETDAAEPFAVSLVTSSTEILKQPLPVDQAVRGEWGMTSLPRGYRALDGAPRIVTPTSGEVLEWSLPLAATRTVEGRVFLDQNADGKLNPDEETLAGVVVNVDGRHAVSEARGRYVVRGVSSGVKDVLVVGGVPEGWDLVPPITVEMSHEPVLVRNIDLALIPTTAGAATVAALVGPTEPTDATTTGLGALTEVRVSPMNAILSPDEQISILASGIWADGKRRDLTGEASWTSSNPSVATVDLRGRVTAKKEGFAQITATYERMDSRSVLVDVVDVPIIGLSLTSSDLALVVDEAARLGARAIYSDGRRALVTDDLRWESSDLAVARVTASGEVIATGPGTAKIYASIGNLRTFPANVVVGDEQVSSLRVTWESQALSPGDRVAATVTAVFEDGREIDVSGRATYRIIDPSVLRAEPGALPIALTAGRSLVVASWSTGQSIPFEVTVTGYAPTGITLRPSVETMLVGTKAQLSATAVYPDGTMGSVTEVAEWSSSVPEVIEAHEGGQIEAVREGTSRVSVERAGVTSVPLDIRVSEADIAAIRILPEALYLELGESTELQAQVTLEDGSTADATAVVQWFSASPDVIQVDVTGIVHAKSLGTSVLHAEWNDIVSDPIIATVMLVAPDSLHTAPEVDRMVKGAIVRMVTTAISKTGTRSDASSDATWTSSDPTIASVTPDGTIEALSAGTVTLQSEWLGVQAPPVQIQVLRGPVSSLRFITPAVEFRVGETSLPTVVAALSRGQTVDMTSMVEWEIEDPSVVAVDEFQVLTGLAPGTTTVRVKWTDPDDQTFKAKLTVKVR